MVILIGNNPFEQSDLIFNFISSNNNQMFIKDYQIE